MSRFMLTCVPAALLLCACNTAPVMETDGFAYVTSSGRPLYVYRMAKDPSRPACGAECSTAWTPLYAGSYDWSRGDYRIVVRDDGQRQWLYREEPVYFFAGSARAMERDPQLLSGQFAPLDLQ